MDTAPSLGQVLRNFVKNGLSGSLRLSPAQWKCLHALAACRTGALGGQWLFCPHCNREHFHANSCRNRHCPACQGARALDWLEQQRSSLLPIPYYHLVFTLPHQLNELIRQNSREVLSLLFSATSQTLLEFGRKTLGAQIGLTSVLHTWSQTLLEHYHLHCIVSGGGLSLDATHWIQAKPHFLFSVRALSKMFRGKFLSGLQSLYRSGRLEFHGLMEPWAAPERFAFWLKKSARPKWVVFAKRPFAGPDQVLSYLSRYTHRVAIGNRRLVMADSKTVTFSYKADSERKVSKTMTLELSEFVRRFALHILPEKFVKIRHYGWLGNRNRTEKLEKARRLLGLEKPDPATSLPEGKAEVDRTGVMRCPYCDKPGLRLLRVVLPTKTTEPRPPPDSS